MIRSIRALSYVAIATLVWAPMASAVSPLLKEFENAFIELSERVGPAVVEITAESKAPDQKDGELFRFFSRPQQEDQDEDGEEQPRRPSPQRPLPAPVATGSGFIYDRLGHIITNNHVVEKAVKITVELSDGSEHEATLVGTDPDTDLAVIKIDATGLDLVVAEMGDSDTLRIGQFAIAMGSPRGLTGSISFGHISGLGRERLRLPDTNLRFQHFIQTDAAINLGNSGGPLCDIEGNVIGVNIAIVYGANSIGFAIPSSRVSEIVPQLIASGKVKRGWLGVSIQDVAVAADAAGEELDAFQQAYNLPDASGAYVQQVTWGGPAEAAGLHEDDVISKIDGNPVADTLDLINQISSIKPDTTVQLDVWREGERIQIPILVADFPGMAGARFGRDFLGIHVVELSPEIAQSLGLEDGTTGVVVPAIVPESPAANGEQGLREFDIILKVAHKEVKDRDSFRRLIAEHAKPGKTLLLHIKRAQSDVERRFIKVPDDFKLVLN